MKKENSLSRLLLMINMLIAGAIIGTMGFGRILNSDYKEFTWFGPAQYILNPVANQTVLLLGIWFLFNLLLDYIIRNDYEEKKGK